MNEADFKLRIVKSIKAEGGYARRIEDKFAVGVPDMTIIPNPSPAVFFTEAKIFMGRQFRPTPRQFIELMRLHRLPAFGVVIGMNTVTKKVYADVPKETIRVEDAVEMSEGETFSEFFVRLYNERKT